MIHGTGFGESYLLNYRILFQGSSCSELDSGGYFPSSRESDTLLFVTADLRGCMDTLGVTLMYNNFAVTNDFVSIASFDLLRVIDTSQSQGIRPSTSGTLSTVTISGFGFGLSSSEYYSISFMDYSSCVVIPQSVTVVSSAEIVCQVDLNTCTSNTIYVSGMYNEFLSNSGISFGPTPIASLVTLADTSATYGLLASTSQTLTIEGVGFGSSVLSDYLFELRGINCVSLGMHVPSLRSSSSLLTLSNVDLTGCDGTVEARVQYEGIWWDDGDGVKSDGDYVAIGAVAQFTSETSLRGYVSTTAGEQHITIYGSGFGTQVSDGILISFKGSSTSCSSPNQVKSATRLSSSALEVALDISNCEGALNASLSYNGLGYTSQNVSFGLITSISDTGTIQVLDSVSNAHFLITGAGFNDDVVSESNNTCSDTPSSSSPCYDIILGCAGSTSTISGTVLRRISSDSLNVSADLSACSSYDVVNVSMSYQGGTVATEIGVGKIDMVIFEDTSLAYSYPAGSVVNITIDGDSFLSSDDMNDYIVTITVSSGCLNSTYTGSNFITRESETRLIVHDVDLTSCLNGTISASLIYTNAARRRHLSVFGDYGNQIVVEIFVGVILSLNNDQNAFGYVATSHIDVTIQGEGFLAARESAYSVNMSDTSGSCNIDGNTRYNVTFVSDTTILVLDLNMTGCEGTIRAMLHDGEVSNTVVTEIGTMVSILDASSTNGVYATTNQKITVFGTGFASSVSSDYHIVLSSESSSSSLCGSSDTKLVQRISTESLLITADFTGCVGTIQGTLYYMSQTSQYMSTGIAVVTSLVETFDTQGVESEVEQTLTIEGLGFTSSSTRDYLIRLDDTANICNQVFTIPNTVTVSSHIVLSNVDLSSCATTSLSSSSMSTNFLTASLSYRSGPFLAPISIATFNLTRVSDTRTVQGLYAVANSAVTLLGTGFVSDVLSDYTVTSPCAPQGLSVTEVRSVSTLVSSGDLSLCSDGDSITITLDLYSRVSTEIVGTIVGVKDTQTSQGVISQNDFEITIHGYGFASSELSDYNMFFNSGGASCGASSQAVIPHQRVSSEMILAKINLQHCSGTQSLFLSLSLFQNS